MTKQVLAAAMAVCVSGSAALAAPVVSDSYVIGTSPAAGEYVAGTSINAQPAGLVNTGFVNGPYASGTTTSQFTAIAGGLDFGGVTHESGGAVQFNAAARDGVTRTRARNLGSGSTAAPFNTATNGVFYSSVMLERGSIPTVPTSSSFAGVGFSNTLAPSLTTTGVMTGFWVGYSNATTGEAASNFGSLVIRSRAGTSSTGTFDTILVDGATTSTASTTYFIVVKSTVNAPTDSIEYWLNPTDVATEASMTASSLAHGVIDATTGGGYSYLGGTADFTRLSFSATDWDGNVRFDEPRTGLTLRDVAVPEPTTLAALAGGLLTLARRRRRA